jgi:hypothetical protein
MKRVLSGMNMKLKAMKEMRFPGGWIVFICAFLAVGVFITFEVLDLDGSNFQHPFRDSVIAAEPTSADVEQLRPRCPSAAWTQSSLCLCPNLPLPPEPLEVRSRSGVAGLRARLNHALPRASLRHEPSSTALSDDPA